MCLGVAVALTMGAQTHASQSITVAAPTLANLYEPDDSGLYQRLVERALESLDVKVEPAFYPYRRAIQVFEESRVDCLFSLTDVLRQRVGDDGLVYSYPFGKFSFHIFTRSEDPPVESLDELKGLVVGRIKGHEVYLASALPGSVELQAVRSEAQAVQMLDMGRLDALVAAVPDMRPYLDRLSYAPELTLLEGFDRINCHDTERNRAFIRDLSAQLRRLKKEGVYREVMGSLYIPFEVAR
ncbi:MAG: substrate-binding periplasmic protein [Pseudomonadota bacterium]